MFPHGWLWRPRRSKIVDGAILVVVVLWLLFAFASLARAQAVVIPAPVPVCTDGDTLVWDSGVFVCQAAGGTGTSGGGGSDIVARGVGGSSFTLNTTPASLLSQSVTVAAGDTIEVEVAVMVLNNSGTTRTYQISADLGGMTLTLADAQTVGASGTNRSVWKWRARYVVISTSDVRGMVHSERSGSGASGASLTTVDRMAWNTSSSNLTGSKTMAVTIVSSSNTTTQTGWLMDWKITRLQ